MPGVSEPPEDIAARHEVEPVSAHQGRGNAYDGFACLFGIRNTFGFRPVAEGRGFPSDASEGLASEFAVYGGPADVFGTTWLTWAEVAAVDWAETDSSGTRSRGMVAGDESDWGRVWIVMRTLSEVHGAKNVRLVVWFH
ncbi:hypothetical protein [Streptomyces sp. NPDC127112]|uniref:hypothetical protein n=1 Tax=Streptomyces sp. NPDC127112 TaxID=3345364 RepID=UPI0036409EC2